MTAMTTSLGGTGRGHQNGGQRSKGPRRFVGLRLPEDLANQVGCEADRLGLYVSEYLTLLAARAHGHEVPAYILAKLDTNQAQLPLGA